jgi:fatty acid desaturase
MGIVPSSERRMAMNVGSTDRLLRVLAGAALVAAAALGFISPLGYVGLIPFVTGLVGYCPVYRLLRQHP